MRPKFVRAGAVRPVSGHRRRSDPGRTVPPGRPERRFGTARGRKRELSAEELFTAEWPPTVGTGSVAPARLTRLVSRWKDKDGKEGLPRGVCAWGQSHPLADADEPTDAWVRARFMET